MVEMKTFNNTEFGLIRSLMINEDPWFVGKDISQAFGDKNHSRSLSRVDDEDKREEDIIDALGRKQKAIFVNESGLYSLLFSMQPQKSNNDGVSDAYSIKVKERIEKLHRFKRWVTSEVLPSIRKNGMYAKDELLDNPDLLLEVITKLKLEREAKKMAEQKAMLLEEELDRSKDWYSIKRVASLNGVDWKTFDWRRLKNTGKAMGYDVKKIFDSNYGFVNTYHREVWEKAYPEYEL